MMHTVIALFLALGAAPALQIHPPGTPGQPAVEAIEAVPALPVGQPAFFGYYGMPPWDASGRYMVCLTADFDGRPVEQGESARILLVDLQEETAKPIAETRAWNFQQGALLHWVGKEQNRRIVFNDRLNGQVRAVVLDVFTGERHSAARPISAVAPNGITAASLNYGRLSDLRPGYGYAGAVDPYADHPHSPEDGLYVLDLAAGKPRLVVSLDQVFHAHPVPEAYRDKKMWLNHALFSRAGDRIFFLARYQPDMPGPLVTAAFTVGIDGRDLRCILPYDWGASHFDWAGQGRMVVTTRHQGQGKWRHVLLRDGAPLDTYQVLAPELLDRDGHCHVSPNGRWMITDSYPRGRDRMQSLYLVDLETGAGRALAALHQPPDYKSAWRCDLHPRWHRNQPKISIDSTHTGTRRTYQVLLHLPGDASPGPESQ